jgi:hypothetical protein
MRRGACVLGLALAACHAQPDASDGGALDLAGADLSGPVYVSLAGKWSFSSDAQGTPDPAAFIIGTPDGGSITVEFHGSGACGCSAEHLVVALPREMPCDSTHMQFDWFASPAAVFYNNALRVDFDPNGGSTGAKGQFVGSEWVGNSACAYNFMNHFGTPAQLRDGGNDIPLGILVRDVNGSCTHGQSFDKIDIHVEGYACADGDVTATLANFVLVIE